MRSGERTSPRYSEDTEAVLGSSIARPLCIFSARFAVDNGTFGADTPVIYRRHVPHALKLATVLTALSTEGQEMN